MSKYANPPKLRSYIDHKPNSVPDNKPKWGRTFDTYFDHFPDLPTDVFMQTGRPFNSYVDHFAKPGDTRLQ